MHRHVKSFMLGLCGLVAVGLGASQASALTVNHAGQITDWGNLNPFSGAVPTGITGVNGNDYSPLNYPNGIGHQPSPGGNTGEKFDLEGLYAYRTDTQVKVLLVASSGFQATAHNQTFNLGDLLIDVDGDKSFDYGLVTNNSNAGLTKGGLYEIEDTRNIQNKPGSYYHYSDITDAIGAWAVTDGDLLEETDILTKKHNYAGEYKTWLYEFTFNLAQGLQYSDLYLQLAWGCGNDMIGLDLAALDLPNTPDGPPDNPNTPDAPATPEPATAAMGIMGMASLLAATRRRRSR